MNYIKLIGGLGNQLFQYAFAYHIYKKNNKVKLDITEFKYYRLHNFVLQNFKIRLQFAKPGEVRKFYLFKSQLLYFYIRSISRKFFIFINKIFNKSNIHYESSKFNEVNNFLNFHKIDCLHDGYWQSFKFLEVNKDDLISQIKLKRVRQSHKKILNKISKKRNSVAVHIRWYRSIKNEDKYHGNISQIYINKAMKKIETKIKNPFYFIFTNSSISLLNNIKIKGSNFEIIKGFKDYEDLISIAECDHQIISNSTFGWWGAWLNSNKNKIVIVPKKWFLIKKNPLNLIPKKWLKI